MKLNFLLLLLTVFPSQSFAETKLVDEILFQAPCLSALKAAIARDNTGDSVFREDEKEVAYAFILGLGANDPRPGTMQEVVGRALGAAAYYCDRNPDVSLFEIGRIIGRE